MSSRRIELSENERLAAEQRMPNQPISVSSPPSPSNPSSSSDDTRQTGDFQLSRKLGNHRPGAGSTIERLSENLEVGRAASSAISSFPIEQQNGQGATDNSRLLERENIYSQPRTTLRRYTTPDADPTITTHTQSANPRATDSLYPHLSSALLPDGPRRRSWQAANTYPLLNPPSLPSASSSSLSDTTVADPSCSHAIHPAYSDSYTDSLCPLCRLNACISAVEITNSMLMRHGGSNQWVEHIKRMPSCGRKIAEANEARFWRGRETKKIANKRVRVHTRSDGSLSYTASRKKIMNLNAELEGRRARELEWENGPMRFTHFESHLLLTNARPTAAIAALKRLDEFLNRQNLYAVERASLEFSRKRGREMEVANSDDFPGSHDIFESGLWSVTNEQKEFIDATLANDINIEYNSASALSRRKRRRLDVSLKFHPLVYIRTEADIDALCGPTAKWKDVAQQPAQPRTSRGILRTAPALIDPTPRRAHIATALNSEGKQTTERRIWRKEACWPPTSGSERVDTSGKRYGHQEDNDWMAWALYVDSFDANPVDVEAVTPRDVATSNQQIFGSDLKQQKLYFHAETLIPGPDDEVEDEDFNRIDPFEEPTPAEHATLQERIELRTAKVDAASALASARQAVADAREVMSEMEVPVRVPRPGQQRYEQRGGVRERSSDTREIRNHESRTRFRPHGGIASVFHLSSSAYHSAAALLRRLSDRKLIP